MRGDGLVLRYTFPRFLGYMCQFFSLPCSHKIRLGGFLPFVSHIPFQSFCCLDSLPGKGGSQGGRPLPYGYWSFLAALSVWLVVRYTCGCSLLLEGCFYFRFKSGLKSVRAFACWRVPNGHALRLCPLVFSVQHTIFCKI